MVKTPPPSIGQLLIGPLFNEPMRVEAVQSNGAASWIVGLVGTNSERFRKVTMTAEDLQRLTVLDPQRSFNGDGRLLQVRFTPERVVAKNNCGPLSQASDPLLLQASLGEGVVHRLFVARGRRPRASTSHPLSASAFRHMPSELHTSSIRILVSQFHVSIHCRINSRRSTTTCSSSRECGSCWPMTPAPARRSCPAFSFASWSFAVLQNAS
jgi:hypothetical protein